MSDTDFAVQVRGCGAISPQYFMPPNYTATALLMAKVEDFLLSGKPAWSVERSLAAGAMVGGGAG